MNNYHQTLPWRLVPWFPQTRSGREECWSVYWALSSGLCISRPCSVGSHTWLVLIHLVLSLQKQNKQSINMCQKQCMGVQPTNNCTQTLHLCLIIGILTSDVVTCTSFWRPTYDFQMNTAVHWERKREVVEWVKSDT